MRWVVAWPSHWNNYDRIVGDRVAFLPDKQSGEHEHGGQVDGESCFKIELFEEGGGIDDEQEEEGGKVCGQELIGQHTLEYYFHF